MARIQHFVITDAGRDLQALSMIGRVFHFTRAAVGDAVIEDIASVKMMTALPGERREAHFTEPELLPGGQVRLTVVVDNDDNPTAFPITCAGIYAKGTGSGDAEILFAVADMTQSPDMLPFGALGETDNPTEYSYHFTFAVGEDAQITFASSTVTDLVRKGVQLDVLLPQFQRWADDPSELRGDVGPVGPRGAPTSINGIQEDNIELNGGNIQYTGDRIQGDLSIDDAIDQLFLSAGEGKARFAGIVGGPASEAMTFQEIADIGQEAKNIGAEALGVEPNASLVEMFSAVNALPVGFNMGDGSDGVFETEGDVVWDTSAFAHTPYIRQFESFTIREGHTVTLSHPVPVVVILCQGDAQIDGVLDLDGLGQYVNINIAGINDSMPTLVPYDRTAHYPLPTPGTGGVGGNGGAGGGDYYNYNNSRPSGGAGGAGARGGAGWENAYIGDAAAGAVNTVSIAGINGTAGRGGLGGGAGSGGNNGGNNNKGGRGGGTNASQGLLSTGEKAAGGNLLLVATNIHIGNAGRIFARGLSSNTAAEDGAAGVNSSGGSYQYAYGGGGGGGGGGGHAGGGVAIYFRNLYQNIGQIDTAGGFGGIAGKGGIHPSSSSYNGVDGASGASGTAGVIDIIQLGAEEEAA